MDPKLSSHPTGKVLEKQRGERQSTKNFPFTSSSQDDVQPCELKQSFASSLSSPSFKSGSAVECNQRDKMDSRVNPIIPTLLHLAFAKMSFLHCFYVAQDFLM